MTSINASEIIYKPVTNVDEAYEIEILGKQKIKIYYFLFKQ
jgi:hypothetical protein